MQKRCIITATVVRLQAVEADLLEYERKTPLEHILLRPGMYIGQTTQTASEIWAFNKDLSIMEKKKLTFAPGLFKIFDEILVNAADNFNRQSKSTGQRMTRIDVSVSVLEPKRKAKKANKKLFISIKNDGRGIPINIHPKENIHVI